MVDEERLTRALLEIQSRGELTEKLVVFYVVIYLRNLAWQFAPPPVSFSSSHSRGESRCPFEMFLRSRHLRCGATSRVPPSFGRRNASTSNACPRRPSSGSSAKASCAGATPAEHLWSSPNGDEP